MSEEWRWPYRARSRHYFVRGISLCRRRRIATPASLEHQDCPEFDDESNCQECMEKLKKRKEKMKG